MRRNSTRALKLAHLVGPAIRASEDDEQDKARRAEDEENDRDDKPGSRRARRADDDQDKEDDKPQGRVASRRRAKASGRSRPRASEEEEDRDDEPSGRRARGRRAEDDEQDDEQEDKPSGRRARSRRAEDDDEDDDADPKGRRTAAEDDDEGEDDDDGDDEAPKARAARRRERERCQAIICSKHAKGREASAAQLAFGTGMSSRAAISLLKTLPGGDSANAGAGAGGLSGAMAAYGGHRPAASAPPAPSGRQAVSNSWDAAAKKAGIRTQ